MQGKAGPLLNQTECVGCHAHNGPGVPPLAGQTMSSMVVKVFADQDDEHGGAAPHPADGKQLQDKSLGAVPAEGQATVHFTEVSGQFADGTPYTLRKPQIEFSNLSSGPIQHAFCAHCAPPVGLGLLERFPKRPFSVGPIRTTATTTAFPGAPNPRRPDFASQKLGRFGWKYSQSQHHPSGFRGVAGRHRRHHECVPRLRVRRRRGACKAAGAGAPELPDADSPGW